MDLDLFHQLLNAGESKTLDFKKEQYSFVKATDEQKSELLKDILGFANASRDSTAFILIGVEEVLGEPARVVGIPSVDHMADHALQQFVNNLTTKPLEFRYETLLAEEKHVGIIAVDVQARPLYLRKDYGRLKKDLVYVRRGSTTDPTKPATPDEIAQMGASHNPVPRLGVAFADHQRDESLGTETTWRAELCALPERAAIPDLVRANANFLPAVLSGKVNSDYFRELARHEFIRRLMRPIRILVQNHGPVPARNVRVELILAVAAGIEVLEHSEFPDPPPYTKESIDTPIVQRSRSTKQEQGDVRVHTNNERHRITVQGGDLQPGRQVWSDSFYLGTTTEEILIEGKIFADNLPAPYVFTLAAKVELSHTELSVDDVCALPQWHPKRGEKFYIYGDEQDDPVQPLTWNGFDPEEKRLLAQKRVFKTREAAERAKQAAFQSGRHRR
jgi:hypothetical protein